MNSKKLLLSLVLVIAFLSLQAQRYTSPEEEKALKYLESIKEPFKTTTNDSVFVVEHSDERFEYLNFIAGDHAADIEEQIYAPTVKPGDVVGPFRGMDTLHYIFKIVNFKDTTRMRGISIIIRPKDMTGWDSTKLNKTMEKYRDAIMKGKDYRKMADKEDLTVRLKNLGWYYAFQDDKEFFNNIFNKPKGDVVIIKTRNGPVLVQIINGQEKVHYKTRVIPISKRG